MCAAAATGRLADRSAAPERGERTDEVVRHRNLVVEQILSGTLDGPADYVQQQDEWVVVVAGAAVLEVGGERRELAARDWLFLPAGTPHRLVSTEPGTEWLAVHLWPDGSGPPAS
jgi:cupin 2 domain-containing protein